MSNCEFLQSPLCLSTCLGKEQTKQNGSFSAIQGNFLHPSNTTLHNTHHTLPCQCDNTPQPHHSIPGQRIGEWIIPSSFSDIQSNLLFLENCDKGKHWGACLKNKTDRRSQSTLVKSLDHFANDWAEGASLWVKRGVLPPQPFVWTWSTTCPTPASPSSCSSEMLFQILILNLKKK